MLAHLSLLFVPAGAGVVAHLDRLSRDGLAPGVAILDGTVLAILAGLGAVLLVSRRLGARDG